MNHMSKSGVETVTDLAGHAEEHTTDELCTNWRVVRTERGATAVRATRYARVPPFHAPSGQRWALRQARRATGTRETARLSPKTDEPSARSPRPGICCAPRGRVVDRPEQAQHSRRLLASPKAKEGIHLGVAVSCR